MVNRVGRELCGAQGSTILHPPFEQKIGESDFLSCWLVLLCWRGEGGEMVKEMQA